MFSSKTMRKNHLEMKKILVKKSNIWPIVKVANSQHLFFTLFSVNGLKICEIGVKS
jgi:hypothetical protein